MVVEKRVIWLRWLLWKDAVFAALFGLVVAVLIGAFATDAPSSGWPHLLLGAGLGAGAFDYIA